MYYYCKLLLLLLTLCSSEGGPGMVSWCCLHVQLVYLCVYV